MSQINCPAPSHGLGLILLYLTAFASAGCSTLQLPDFPERPVQQQQFKASQGGLAVGAYPITDKSEAKEYFGVDLLAANILAVAVTVENRSTDSGFLLEKQRIRLGSITEGTGDSKDKPGDETAGIALASLGGLVTIPVGAKLASDARIINHNFETKELRATTVNPGQAVHGFLYFQLPDQASIHSDYLLRLEALELKTRQYKKLEIPLHLDRN